MAKRKNANIQATLEQLAAAAHEAKGDDPEGFYSVEELAGLTGMSRHAIRSVLKQAQNDNRLDVKNRTFTNLAGRLAVTPCYRITGG